MEFKVICSIEKLISYELTGFWYIDFYCLTLMNIILGFLKSLWLNGKTIDIKRCRWTCSLNRFEMGSGTDNYCICLFILPSIEFLAFENPTQHQNFSRFPSIYQWMNLGNGILILSGSIKTYQQFRFCESEHRISRCTSLVQED